MFKSIFDTGELPGMQPTYHYQAVDDETDGVWVAKTLLKKEK